MPWTSTSEHGFTLIEVLVTLTLTLLLGLAVAPLWLSLQTSQVQAGDRAIALLQARVAAARLERDLRLASASGCPFESTTPVLEASSRQLILITRTGPDQTQEMVEWELADGSLMRRRGDIPETIPPTFPHGLFFDHKTMLEDLAASCAFRFSGGGRDLGAAPGDEELSLIDTVELHGSIWARDGNQAHKAALAARAGVGR